MKSQTLILCAALTLSATAQALQPATQGDPYVEKVTLQWGGNAAPVVILRNASGSPLVDKISIQPEGNVARISLNGNVKCMKDKKINFDRARAYFGPAMMSGGSIDDAQVLYGAPYHPSFTEWDGVGNGQWNTEAGNQQTFDVPLGAIKDGPANVAFDPVAEFDKRLQAHVQQGGKKIDFLRKNQEFSVSRTISLGGWCKQDSTSRPGVNSAFVNLKVRYVGDNALTEPPQLNAQLANQGNMPNQINQDLPMKLVSATFQPNMPHYIGACPPADDPTIRVNYMGSGKGTVRFSFEDGSSPVHGTLDIPFDASKGPAHIDFKYPLKAKLVARPEWNEVNKTFNHQLSVRAKYRDEASDTWSAWQDFGSANWNHRCTPNVNVGVGGTVGGFNNGAPEAQPDGPASIRKPLAPLGVKPLQRATPPSAGPGSIAPMPGQPVTPMPGTAVQRVEVEGASTPGVRPRTTMPPRQGMPARQQ